MVKFLVFSSALFVLVFVGQVPVGKRMKGQWLIWKQLSVLGWGGVAAGRLGAQGQRPRGLVESGYGVHVQHEDQYGFLLPAGGSYRAVPSSENPW